MDRHRQQPSESVLQHDLRHVVTSTALAASPSIRRPRRCRTAAHRLDHASATSRPRLEAEQHRPAATRRSSAVVWTPGPVPGRRPVLRRHGGFLDRCGQTGGRCHLSAIQLHPSLDPVLQHHFRDGIAVTFRVGKQLVAAATRLYLPAWEDFSTGFDNIILSASFDDGQSWTPRFGQRQRLIRTRRIPANLATAATGRSASTSTTVG